MTIHNEIHKLIIESYLNDHGKKEISSMFNVKYNTVNPIINVYNKEDRYVQKQKGGERTKKLSNGHYEILD